MNETIQGNDTLQVNEKSVNIRYTRNPNELPLSVSASHSDKDGLQINVHQNIESGKVSYSVNNSVASASTTAVFVQAIRTKITEIINELKKSITA